MAPAIDGVIIDGLETIRVTVKGIVVVLDEALSTKVVTVVGVVVTKRGILLN